MLGAALILPAIFIGAYASGEFSVLSSPSSLAFKGDEKLNSAYLNDVFSASLGRSVSGNSHWAGLYINDPFNLPESAIAVVIDGVNHLKFSPKTKTYSLYGSATEESLSALASNLNVADVDLDEGVDKVEQFTDVFGAIEIPDIAKETSNLKPQLHSEDKLFLQQIAVLNKLSESLGTNGNLPSLTIIRLSINSIRMAHGEKSAAVHEAERQLVEALEKLATSVESNEKVLMVAIATSNEYILRTKRQAAAKLTPADINVASYYSEDFPVIFNIILWFMIVLAFSLLAISYALATMDPGRDSIIYRMTSTRMKKDN